MLGFVPCTAIVHICCLHLELIYRNVSELHFSHCHNVLIFYWQHVFPTICFRFLCILAPVKEVAGAIVIFELADPFRDPFHGEGAGDQPVLLAVAHHFKLLTHSISSSMSSNILSISSSMVGK
jgi:hypothetical protein